MTRVNQTYITVNCRVMEVYGGKGKVKVRRRLWAGESDKKNYSVKYLGPEKAAGLLEKALHNVKVQSWKYFEKPSQELQRKSGLWKFTQRLEVDMVTQ